MLVYLLSYYLHSISFLNTLLNFLNKNEKRKMGKDCLAMIEPVISLKELIEQVRISQTPLPVKAVTHEEEEEEEEEETESESSDAGPTDFYEMNYAIEQTKKNIQIAREKLVKRREEFRKLNRDLKDQRKQLKQIVKKGKETKNSGYSLRRKNRK